MKLRKISLYKYSLPLKKQLVMKGSSQNNRNGLILEIMDNNGFVGYGDAAPFPGLHIESLEDIADEFISASSFFKNMDFQAQLNIWQMLNQLPSCSPSLQFGLDWAVVDLVSKIKKISPDKLLTRASNKTLLLNGLLTGTPDDILREAVKLKTKNYKSIKLKVAVRSLEEEINLVLKLDNLLGDNVSLRLDANQSWDYDRAVGFAKAVKSANIEYIEEPCSGPQLFENFYNETGLPYAFDETLSQKIIYEIKDYRGLSALIIKPSVLGKLASTKKWAEWAYVQNKNLVFSSAFESGVGLRAISSLIAAYAKKDTPHGLDTFRWLNADITLPPFSAQNDVIDLSNQDFQLIRDSLIKIYEYTF